MKIKLPIGNEWRSTLSRWASEIRAISFLTEIDFLPKNFEPFIQAQSTMTLSALQLNYAKYLKIGPIVFFYVNSSFTTATAAQPVVYCNFPPIPPAVLPGQVAPEGIFTCAVFDNSIISGTAFPDSAIGNRLAVRKFDASNWNLGANKGFRLSGFYWV